MEKSPEKSTEKPKKKPSKKAAKTPKWSNRIVGHAEIPASEIKAHPLNFRIHPDTQRAAVSEALTRLGWIESVLINKKTGRLLNGHLRVELAAARGEVVPVDYVELSEAEERLALASIDPLGALAIEDPEKLSELLSGIEIGDSALDTLLSTSAQDADLARLFGEDDSDGATASEGPRLPNHGQNIAIVIAISDLGLFEKAIRNTGEANRGNAIMKICRKSLGEEDDEF
jgi:hypothetical protein